MLRTEDEASKTLCPVMRPEVAAMLRGYPCVGAECMAWRQALPQRETVKNYRDAPAVQPAQDTRVAHSYSDGWHYSYTDTDRDGRKFDLLHRLPADDAPRLGYCGLAGKVDVE